LERLKNKEYQKGTPLLQQFRNVLVKKENYQTENQWIAELPADTRDCAIKELLQAFTTNRKVHQHFNLTFKSRKKSNSIEIRAHRQYQVTRGQYKFLSDIKTTEQLPELTHDIKIQMDTDGSFYLIIPMDVMRNDNQVPPHRIISIDPGIRTLMTGYTPDGFVYHLGRNDIQLLCRLMYYRNKLQGRMVTHRRKNKHRIRLAFKRAGNRIKNLVDECHKKLTHWLYENFDMILIPKLDTNSFCRKRMRKKTKNMIKVWRHCSLIDRLINKQREYPETHLLIPTEEYTSKTCSKCGHIHQHLGTNKEFLCPENDCRMIMDRDVNGAFNILLKTLTEVEDASRSKPFSNEVEDPSNWI